MKWEFPTETLLCPSSTLVATGYCAADSKTHLRPHGENLGKIYKVLPEPGLVLVFPQPSPMPQPHSLCVKLQLD